MERHVRSLLSSALVLSLAACSNGTGGDAVPGGRYSSSGALSAASRAKIAVTIRIKIPRRRHHHRVLIRGHYVSPATQSIAIAVTPSSGPVQNFNADLTPASNPNCKTSLISPPICTVTLSLVPGNYTATFATYDGLLSGGNAPDNPPTGNQLSANQNVPLTIVTGRANRINVTLDGIPTAAVMVPGANSGMTGSSEAGYTISKCFSSAKVSVFGIDADGNYILGPGAPKAGLASDDTAHLAVIAASSPSPNTFTLTRPSIPNKGTNVHLTGSATPDLSSGGSTLNAMVTITFNGDVCGVFTEFSITTSNSDPVGITSGPDGALWFAEASASKIGRITTAGTITNEYTTATAASRPHSIVTGGDGALWFTEFSANKVGRITTSGAATDYATTGSSSPEGIAAGSDGALWFVECATYKIGRITTGGTVTNEYATTSSVSDPFDIAAGPDAALWFTECSKNKIGRVATNGDMTEFAIPTTASSPFGIAAGSDGALWFAENVANQIGRVTLTGAFTEYSIPTGASEPNYITGGPDGALWFTEFHGNNIGRITVGGAFTEYPIPSGTSLPEAIATGPDGALWFSESGTNKIGRLQ